MTSRRALLATGALVALSGCSALGGASARLARIRLENDGSTGREFDLTFTVDGETAYEETHTVDGNASSVTLTDELTDERGRITIETNATDGDVSRSTTLDGDNCYDVIVEYTGDDLIYWQSETDGGCEGFVTE